MKPTVTTLYRIEIQMLTSSGGRRWESQDGPLDTWAAARTARLKKSMLYPEARIRKTVTTVTHTIYP